MMFFSFLTREKSPKEKVQYIYQNYHRLMLKISYDILQDSQLSEDAVYDAFVTIIEKIDEIELEEGEKIPSLIAFIVKAKSIDIIRKRSHLVFLPNPRVEESERSMCMEFDEGAEELLRRLDPSDAELLRWRILEDREYSEIASYLNITESTARKRMERAKKKLKKRLEEGGER